MTVQAATGSLRDVGIFQGLAEAELRSLLEGAERKEFASGEAIYQEGDPTTGLFVIESGKVTLGKLSGGGKTHDLATIDAKHVFGEMGLVSGKRARTVTARAAAPTVVWHFPSGRFTSLIESGSAAASKVLLNMARMLSGRLDALNKEFLKLVDMSDQEKTRVAGELAGFKDKLYKEWSF